VETFKAANKALPGDADILHRLAVAQRRAGYLEDAIATFEQAILNDPAFSRSPTTMIETLLFMNEIDRITKLIDQFILRYPDARDLRVHKVRTYILRGDLESARILVDSMPPSGSSAYYTTVPFLPLFERDYEMAIKVWEIPEIAASSSNRGYSSSENITKAWIYRLIGDEELALENARLVIERINSLPRTGSYIDGFEYSDLATAYALIGEFDKALEVANSSIQIIPEDKDFIFGTNLSEARAQVLGMIGKRDEALAEIERLLDHPTGFNRWDLYLDPRWDFFRDDERFNDLVRPLNLQEVKQ
jgi:tetratricopeptide (TPR) repeat protein